MKGYSRRSWLAASGAVAIGLSLGDSARAVGSDTLLFYNWDTYVGETTLEDFQAATGTKVEMRFFLSNDELIAALTSGKSFDVVVPSDAALSHLAKAGLLRELDHTLLPNFANIGEAFRDPPYDPGCRFAIPYTWLVLGIGYRKSKMVGDNMPDSWKWIFDTDRFGARVAVPSDADALIPLLAMYLGYDPVALTDEALTNMEVLLLAQKDRFLFHEDNGQDMLLAGDVDLVIEYNGDIALKIQEDGDLAFVVPREGSVIYADNWAIPASANNPLLAHRFLNFMMDARAGADILRAIWYPTPNTAARALMSADYRDSPAIFPPSDALARCRSLPYAPPERRKLFQALIDRVRAA